VLSSEENTGVNLPMQKKVKLIFAKQFDQCAASKSH
jgi:hypothetical protein